MIKFQHGQTLTMYTAAEGRPALLPCPSCGSDGAIYVSEEYDDPSQDSTHAVCCGCPAEAGHVSTRGKDAFAAASELWNTRGSHLTAASAPATPTA